eukprot:maker-scaffold_3-snap-gene-14.43-mRNA-1 protein AED:0.08 eAED:0.08 QI:0/0/0/0.66/0.5/0.33/3/0/556
MGQINSQTHDPRSNEGLLQSVQEEVEPLEAFYRKYNMTNTVLGSGSYARVRLCTHIESGVYFAVKIVDKDQFEGHLLDSFHKEIGIMKTLSHRNIVRIYGHYEDKDYIFIVMEYFVGGDLFEMIEGIDDFTEDAVKSIARVLIRALRYCMKEGIIHRDIKPENILLRQKTENEGRSPIPLTYDEFEKSRGSQIGLSFSMPDIEKSILLANEKYEIVLADFGLATSFKEKNIKKKTGSSLLFFTKNKKLKNRTADLELLQTQCGTPSHLAPEIIRGKKYNFKCDIWSLGILIFTLLSCGQHPFPAKDLQTLYRMVLKGKFTFYPQSIWDQVSEEAKDFLGHVLVVNPKNRFSYDEMLSHPWLSKRERFDLSVNPYRMSQLPKLDSKRFKEYNLRRKVLRITKAKLAVTKFEKRLQEDEKSSRPSLDLDMSNVLKDFMDDKDLDNSDSLEKKLEESNEFRYKQGDSSALLQRRPFNGEVDAQIRIDVESDAERELRELLGLDPGFVFPKEEEKEETLSELEINVKFWKLVIFLERLLRAENKIFEFNMELGNFVKREL